MRSLLAPFLEVKLDAGQPGRFRGYGSTFGNVDLGKDRCAKGCFARSLGEHAKAGTLPAMYWMHDRSEPVGDWVDMGEDNKGLYTEGQLWTGDNETECSRKSGNLLRGTGPKGMSIGYATRKYSFDQKLGIRTLEDVDLFEVSIVGYGMNPKALVTHIKSLVEDGEIPTIRDIEEALRDAGLSATQAKAILSSGYKALVRDAEIPTAADEIKVLLRMRAALRGEEPGD
jgi:HK97 family phage prohead protease